MNNDFPRLPRQCPSLAPLLSDSFGKVATVKMVEVFGVYHLVNIVWGQLYRIDKLAILISILLLRADISLLQVKFGEIKKISNR